MRTARTPQPPGLPGDFWTFLQGSCRLPTAALELLPAAHLPPPVRRLLDHHRDMTSTLAQLHASPLRIEILQQVNRPDRYFREVFLRTEARDEIAAYGVTAVNLDRFLPEQRTAIEGGHGPLGGLLHAFQIPFTSAPFAFFAISAGGFAEPAFQHATAACYGRFNRISRSTGEILAWIAEVLPPHTL
jgi:chorismate-pyruvate lyase